jgi:hypothetical protein
MGGWGDDSVDFAEIEDSPSNGVYVNLLENPERYTGYSGHSAHQIWSSIYLENCFRFRQFGKKLKKTGSSRIAGPFEEPSNSECPESVLFYRLISGFHASVSMHISYKYLNISTGHFCPNPQAYEERVGNHPDRIRNLHFTFVILLRALQKAGPYLAAYPYHSGSIYEDQKTRDLIERASNITIRCPNLFNERNVFQGEASIALKREFRHHFRNISRIMDCVGCQKCRLWGKIQVTGLGTALKILFSYDSASCTNYKLTKTEVVSFINTMNRVSESISFHNAFQEMAKERIREMEHEECLERIRFYWVIVLGCLICIALYISSRRCNTE